MSKIALTPNASGTGTFTLAAPNSNTSRTITLPDEAGEVLVNTATGVDVTGTITSDGLTVSSSGAANSLTLTKTDGNATKLVAGNTEGTHTFEFNNGGMFLSDTTGLRLGLGSGGDISFYEDTGTTPKFFWDASAESLGIGTSSPVQKLSLVNGTFQIAGASTFAGNVEIGRVGGDNNMAFATGGSERMRIDASGNLSIGSSEDNPFNWGGSSNNVSITAAGSNDWAQLSLKGNGTGGTGINLGSGSVRHAGIFSLNGSNLAFATNPTNSGTGTAEAMRIDSSGNLLVGTTSSLFSGNHKLEIYTSNAAGDSGIVIKHRDATGATAVNAQLFVNNAGSAVGSIKMTSSSTSYNTSSDYRLKTDAQPMTGASARVQALNPVNFEWIADGTRVDGFLAHEAQEVVPEAVHGTKDAMRDEEYEVTPAVYEDVVIPAVLDEDGNELEAERTEQQLVTEAVMGTRSVPDYQGIDQSKLVPLLTAALQEALTEITDLKARVIALEAV